LSEVCGDDRVAAADQVLGHPPGRLCGGLSEEVGVCEGGFDDGKAVVGHGSSSVRVFQVVMRMSWLSAVKRRPRAAVVQRRPGGAWHQGQRMAHSGGLVT
jgi:hypothetical protein